MDKTSKAIKEKIARFLMRPAYGLFVVSIFHPLELSLIGVALLAQIISEEISTKRADL
jgi:hypothetical protein